MAASTIAWVPHSTSPTSRTCGNAPWPRPPVGRPNAATLAGVSATSRVEPSSAISRHPRYHAPGVAWLANGRATCTNSSRSGAGPSRVLARALDQQPHDLLVAHLSEQAHGQGVVDHHAGGQQPLALLGPPGPLDHPIHQLGREGPGQHPDRDPIRQAGHHRWLGLASARHPSVITSGRRTLPNRKPPNPTALCLAPHGPNPDG